MHKTHNVALVSPIADFVVDVGSNGRILSQGSLSNALSRDAELRQELQQEEEEILKEEKDMNDGQIDDDLVKQNSGRLVVEEETEVGHVGWRVCTSAVFMPPAMLCAEPKRPSLP